MGSVMKDQYSGKFVTEFKAALDKSGKGFENADVSVGLGQVLASKDDEELVRRFETIAEERPLNVLATTRTKHTESSQTGV